ncbi:MAG TPA: MBOAT family O-acyltransferase [Candidatus Paceibacterota bacterium]|nr:MBOAT family O-acyltransferase [Candidatus Paceibacterota bacterium]
MLFNSFSFLVFFPVVVILYYLLPHRFRWILLLVASCYFYMAFIPAYILILLYLIVIDFFMGILIEKAEGRKRKLFLTISIIANVGTLFFFKYFNFFNANVASVASFLHWNYPIGFLAIALPLGLSFHTFQSLAYVLEVYYKRYPAERHIGIYALYVMFFPQLVAGPIERPQQLLPQLHAEHEFNEGFASQGLRIMIWGFFKKVVVADSIGVIVDQIYGNLHGETGVALAVAAVAFAIQLYADFSGYSDIARGSAKVFGIDLVNNFDVPYFARSISDFWRRWHISLTSWFRDYFYFPLALKWASWSRAGLYAALFVTFLVIGLWHGAGWTFICFGAVFGFYSVFGLWTKKYRDRLIASSRISRYPGFLALFQTLITFGLVCIGFVFFRSTSLSNAIYFLEHLPTGWSNAFRVHFWTDLAHTEIYAGLTKYRLAALPLSCLVMLFGEYLEREKQVTAWIAAHPMWFRWGAYYLIVAWILFFGYFDQQTFIYFQF